MTSEYYQQQGNNMKQWRDKTNRKTLTTGQIAKHCDVAPRTVSKWFDSGRLHGYRIPGSPDRRIPREDFIRFLKANGMPLGNLESADNRILVIGADAPLQAILREHIRDRCDADIAVAASSFEAGIHAEQLNPTCVIVDLAMGRIEAGQIVQAMQPARPTTIFLALTSDEPDEKIFSLGFNDAFKKPFDGALFAERVRRLLAAQGTNGRH
jgi:excisionase family DNA binding protein